jgi:cbb3-type cytochrome oxidase cytochrome c subunit
MQTEIIATLQQLTANLLCMSETEAPFEVKICKDVAFLQTENAKETALTDFFRNPTTEKDWHDETEKATVKQFQVLLAYLQSFEQLRTYKTATPAANIYMVIPTAEEIFVVLQTMVVQT